MDITSKRPKWCNLLICLLCVCATFATIAADTNQEQKLFQLLRAHGYEPLRPEPFEVTKKYILGQALFFDPILSTNNNVSCASCHVFSKGTSDGLSKSIIRERNDTAPSGDLPKTPIVNGRNSLALWNRDDNSVTSLFWDGRVEVIDPEKSIIRTPLETLLPKSIENALAAQSLFPMVSRFEMFSHNCRRNDEKCLEFAEKEKSPTWIQSAHLSIMSKVIGDLNSEKINDTQARYRKLVEDAYPKIPLEGIDIGHIGNAIAHFEEIAFATRDARWDRYLKGDKSALSLTEIDGAVLFFDKANCASCHAGAVFSDYLFYTLGIINYKYGYQIDYGRYETTKKDSDRFLFRTPSLRNATLTSPYMHDGSIEHLKDAIKAHNDNCKADSNLRIHCDSLRYSDKLTSSPKLDDGEINTIIEFLSTLEDDGTVYSDFIVPRSIPSGLTINFDSQAVR